ncbi:SDR family NAD(P)-dependent oxidoreductase [Streptomyces sp. NPDC057137]|uniref:SDR family NAD(P)-dependent oxidoreductase n=1 Tax=Streptomyces sp. NPDC057137 TaxID=3346030 RepID=UPI00362A0C03
MRNVPSVSGRTALITGASSGIGEEFARQLAARGANLVLVARSLDRLDALAESLRTTHRVDVVTEKLDLSAPDASDQLFRRTTQLGISVDILVNNAGLDFLGPATELPVPKLAALIDLNVRTVLENTVRFLPAMTAQGDGVIINVASTAAFGPAPYMAAYGASKACVLSFTQAVSAENAGTGVRILALCPGPTETPMMSGRDSPLGKKRTPEHVVDTALKALSTRKTSVVDGPLNAFFARVVARLPASVLLTMATRTMKGRATASTTG